MSGSQSEASGYGSYSAAIKIRGDPSPLYVHLVAGICGAYAAGAPARGAPLVWGRSFGDVIDYLML